MGPPDENDQAARAIKAAPTDPFPRNESSTDVMASLDMLHQHHATWVRSAGNPELADRYLATWERYVASLRAVKPLRAGEPSPAWAALEDAAEAFARVTAEVTAWRTRLSDRGE